jgi:hypothetical protein
MLFPGFVKSQVVRNRVRLGFSEGFTNFVGISKKYQARNPEK